MADSEAPPISPFWAKAKIILGFAPVVVALGTAITGLVKAYDQTGPKAVYDTLGKKVEENAEAIQDTHSDVKAVWAYLNGMAAGKASPVASAAPSASATTSQAPPKVSSYWSKPKKTEPLTIEEVVGADEVGKSVSLPTEHFNMAEQAPPRLVPVLPEISPPPKTEKLPTFDQVIQDSKKN